MNDGLPSDALTSLMQDSRGFIWMGTFSGLSRFDGYSFITYKNNPTSSNTLRNNYIRSLLEDKQGRLWIAHYQGVDVFDPRTERFLFHWPDSIGTTDASQIWTLREKKDGRIWVCGSRGVYVADPDSLKIKKFDNIGCYSHDIAETKDGSIVSASGRCGVIYLDNKTGERKQFSPTSKNTQIKGPSSTCYSVFVDQSDRIWVGVDDGIHLFNPQEGTFRHYPVNERVVHILQDIDDKLFLAGRNGLYNFHPKTGQGNKLVGGVGANSVLRDRQGNVWIASVQGLHQVRSKKKKFNTHGQFGVEIGSIAQDANNDIWVLGRSSEGINSLFRLNSSVSNLNKQRAHPLRSSGKIEQERSFFSDKNGNIWLASAGMLEKCEATTTNSPAIRLTAELYVPPTASFMDSHGTVWIGDWGSINKFDLQSRAGEEIAFPASTVYSFLEDRFQNLWIGSSSGLARYNLRSNKLDLFTNDPGDPTSLSNNIVYHLMMDRNGNIWAGTGGGLNKMMAGTENDIPKFLNWRASQSALPNDDVYCIVDGGDGTLWLASGNLVSHFFPKENVFRNYDESDGLPGATLRGAGYLSGKGLRTHDGYIMFSSVRGLVVFHPDSLQGNAYVPPIALTGFSIRNLTTPVNGSGKDSLTSKPLLTQNISYTSEIRLTHNQNDFAFEFAALNFENPQSNQYKYKLEPYEKDWIETRATHRVARYTNISPGQYTFRVIGSNDDGVWNEEGVSLTVVLAPPWWQTWWAYSLYGLAFIGLIISWRRYDLRRVKLKHRAEHLTEVDSLKTRFFTNISHEFRTPITLILGPLKKFYHNTSKKDEKEEFGMMIRNGERLHRLINQLLDLSKLEAGKMRLHATSTEIVDFLKEIASSYESLAADKKIKYIFYPEVQELRVYIDQEKISKVVHNLVANAFKFTKTGGEIILNVKKEGEHCLISVKDSGIGIPSDQIDKIFDRFYQVDSSQTRLYEGSGLGMALVKELLDLHHGKISVSSTQGKGSIFTVTLFLGREHLAKDEITNEEYSLSERAQMSDIVIPVDSGESTTQTLTTPDKPTILIIEDNQDMRTYIRKLLVEEYQILEAANGKTGVKLAEENSPDLIISDIMMPEMDGYKVCFLVKTNELTSHIPVILLTAKADRESKLTGLETGADDYLSKPFDADELHLIVRNRIEERRKLRERFSREIMLEPKHVSVTSLDEQFLTKVLAIIEAHIDDEHFSIDELSRLAGYSNMHFYRKIKALSGQTPSLFLRMIRLKRAADLLSRNSDNVAQVAYAVGFSSLSYFNKCFKEQFGVTPGKYFGARQERH